MSTTLPRHLALAGDLERYPSLDGSAVEVGRLLRRAHRAAWRGAGGNRLLEEAARILWTCEDGAAGAYRVVRSSGWPSGQPSVLLTANKRAVLVVRKGDSWSRDSAAVPRPPTPPTPAEIEAGAEARERLMRAKAGLGAPSHPLRYPGGWVLSPADEAALALVGVEYQPGREGGSLRDRRTGLRVGVGRHLARLDAAGCATAASAVIEVAFDRATHGGKAAKWRSEADFMCAGAPRKSKDQRWVARATTRADRRRVRQAMRGAA